MQYDLAGAWERWTEMWEARVGAWRRLRLASNLLRLPELAAGFGLWLELFERHQRHQHQVRELSLQGECDALKEALQHERTQCAQKLAAAAAERKALAQQVGQLGGVVAEANAKFEAQQAAERAKQVQLLGRQISRRMMNRAMAIGGRCNCWAAVVNPSATRAGRSW